MNKVSFGGIRRLICCVAALVGSGACLDLQVENRNAPGRDRALATPEAVETLIQQSYRWWWWTDTHFYPGAAMAVLADGVSSSWANFGMNDASREPRERFNNSPEYAYEAVNLFAWQRAYLALSSAREGLRAVEARREEMVRVLGLARVEQMTAFATLVQAFTHSALAVIFDRSYVVTDSTVLDELTLSRYDVVWDSALALYDKFLDMAEGAEWTLPSIWVGCDGDWTPQRAAEVAKAYRAAYRAQVARNPDERAAVDWDAVRADATPGLSSIYAGFYRPNPECGWSWTGTKWPLLLHEGWGRTDYRMLGPADASGEWERWINAGVNARRPFNIDTDDRRVTGGAFNDDGIYFEYHGNSPFRPERGIYHFSHYQDNRWDYIYQANFEERWPVFDQKELDFLVAEADYRSGDMASVMAIVNKYRRSGGLPSFANAGGVAPGGSRCVPQNADGTCGDLWEALKYDKRIEVHGYRMGINYTDDRGWGDLVAGSIDQFPVPGDELQLLGLPNYTCPSDECGAKVGAMLERIPSGGVVFADGDLTDQGIQTTLALVEAWSEMSNIRLSDFLDDRR